MAGTSDKQYPEDLFRLGIEYLREAGKQFGRDFHAEARDAFESLRPPKMPDPAPAVQAPEVRIAEALERIADSLESKKKK